MVKGKVVKNKLHEKRDIARIFKRSIKSRITPKMLVICPVARSNDIGKLFINDN